MGDIIEMPKGNNVVNLRTQEGVVLQMPTDEEKEEKIKSDFAKALELQEEGGYDEAEKIYLSILDINPDHLESNINLGIVKYNKKNFGDAIKLFLKAVELDGNNDLTLYYLADAYRIIESYPWAFETYQKLLTRNPGYVNAIPGYGKVCEIYSEQEDLSEQQRNLYKNEAIKWYKIYIASPDGYDSDKNKLRLRLDKLEKK